MREKLAECASQGARTFLKRKQARRAPQRNLHSTFWSHGAAAIKLPAWWLLTLQSSDAISEKNTKTDGEDASIVSGIRDMFLDFLYPVQTLALIRKLQNSTKHHRQATSRLQHCSRGYNSIAKAFISEETGTRQKVEEDEQVADSGVVPSLSLHEKNKLLQMLESADPKISCEGLWRTYQDYREHGGIFTAPEVIKMFRRLAVSEHEADSERLLALFEGMLVEERRNIHYSYAIPAALRLNDLKTAVDLHHEALQRLHSALGTAAILRQAVQGEQWSSALAIWSPLWSNRLLYHTQNELWSGIQSIPLGDLMKRTSALIAHIMSSQGSAHSLDSSLRDFAVELIQHTFSVTNQAFSFRTWRTLWDNLGTFLELEPEIEQRPIKLAALQQILSINTPASGRQALIFYEKILKNDPAWQLPQDVYNTIFDRSIATQAPEIFMSAVNTFRMNHGKLKIQSYLKLFREFARGGLAEPIEQLLDCYIQDFGTPKKRDILSSLIQVHSRRADPERAVSTFNALKSRYDFVPDLASFNMVINAYSKVNEAPGAFEWLQKLKDSGFAPDRYTYTALMMIYSRRGDREAAYELFDEVKECDIRPTLPMLDALVLANVNANNLEEAEELLTDERFSSLEGSRSRMWNMVLRAYALQKEADKVSALHKRMEELGVGSDKQTYAALILALGVAKSPDKAEKLVTKVMPRLGIFPSALHYGYLIGGYYLLGNHAAVSRIYNLMQKEGLRPDMNARNMLLRSTVLAKTRGDAKGVTRNPIGPPADQILEETAESLDRAQLGSSTPSFFLRSQRIDEAFISTQFDFPLFAYGNAGDFETVSQLYDRYLKTVQDVGGRSTTHPPPMQVLSALLVAHIRAGNDEAVQNTWDLIVKKCEPISRKQAAVNTMLGNWVLPAQRLLLSLPLQHYMPYLAHLNLYDELVKLVSDLLFDGYDLTSAGWNIYIQLLCKAPSAAQQYLAFELSERELMPLWPGWDSTPMALRYPRRFLRGLGNRYREVPYAKVPNHTTLVALKTVARRLEFPWRCRSLTGKKFETWMSLDAAKRLPWS